MRGLAHKSPSKAWFSDISKNSFPKIVLNAFLRKNFWLRFDCAGREQQRISIEGARGLQSAFLVIFGHFTLRRDLYGGPQVKKKKKKSAPRNACAKLWKRSLCDFYCNRPRIGWEIVTKLCCTAGQQVANNHTLSVVNIDHSNWGHLTSKQVWVPDKKSPKIQKILFSEQKSA